MSPVYLGFVQPSTSMDLFVRAFYLYLQAAFVLTGLQRLDRLPIISIIQRISYLLWLCTIICFMFYQRLSGGYTSVSGLVGTVSFVCNGSINIIIILESIFKLKHFKSIFLLKQEVDDLIAEKLEMAHHFQLNFKKSMKIIFIIFLLQLACDIIRIYINQISRIQPFFWYTLIVSISLRTRYVQLIFIIINLNGRVEILKTALAVDAKTNEPKSPYKLDIWQPYTNAEYEKLNYMRLIYLRIWEAYRGINKCYGWSLLLLFMMSFFDIVCNCYWTFTGLHKSQYSKYVFNGASSISLASLVITVLYYTDTSEKNSRLIGCMISKLVKPLGNKRYNDLVSEFSIQTLHQRFIVTAKEFFSLNLGLLGRMVAAIVTYLVILIQFMFNEEKSKGHKLSSKNYTAAVAVIIGNISSRLDPIAGTFLNNNTVSISINLPSAMLGNRTSSITGN